MRLCFWSSLAFDENSWIGVAKGHEEPQAPFVAVLQSVGSCSVWDIFAIAMRGPPCGVMPC